MSRTLAVALVLGVVGLLLWRASRDSRSRSSSVDGLLDAIDSSELTEQARDELRAWIASGRLRPSQFAN